MILDKKTIDAKREALAVVSATLKEEFFGLDEIIDQVIRSIEAWYVAPELISRPVIVCLWGCTGVGKTALVRRLASLLGFADRFVEVVMDGGSQHGYWSSTLSSILRNSKIEESQPGILLLDEMQRFRTIDSTGEDIEVERYADTWTLLSDGKFSANSSAMAEIEMMFAETLYDDGGEEEDEEEDAAPKKKKESKMSPWQARNLKKTLRLSEPIAKIMEWKKTDVLEALRAMEERDAWEYDYTKLVIFISGNLDTAFIGSTATSDSDTDADYYHNLTKKVTIAQIKKALTAQFKPEQVARFGSNHIIYPSMSKASYKALIKATCQKYMDDMARLSGKSFRLSEAFLQGIYDNSVFPTQGTRPVFSAIHMIFSSLLIDVAFWMIQEDHEAVVLDLVGDHVRAESSGKEKFFPVDLKLSNQRSQITENYRIMVAVHEAGHAIVYAVLKKCAPFEVKINPVSFRGGYMASSTTSDYNIDSRESVVEDIAVFLAGRCAEEYVFGEGQASTGAESDINNATSHASAYVRSWGFDKNLARIESEYSNRVAWVTKVADTDEDVIAILSLAKEKAQKILTENKDYFVHVVNRLLEVGTIRQEEFIKLSKPFISLSKKEFESDRKLAWQKFCGVE